MQGNNVSTKQIDDTLDLARRATTLDATNTSGLLTHNGQSLDAIANAILEKEDLPPAQWYRWYQEVGGEEVWKHITERNAGPELDRNIKPMFVTACATTYGIVDEDGLTTEERRRARAGALYITDWVYFDFDAGDIQDAIDAVTAFLDKVVGLGVNPDCLDIYASGGKGFHVMVPMAVFKQGGAGGLTVPEMNLLPNILKEIASGLYEDTLDLGVYSRGKGRQFRRPDVQRPNGKYKVPLSYMGVKTLSPETYDQLTSQPAELMARAPVSDIVPEMAMRWIKARDKVGATRKRQQARQARQAQQWRDQRPADKVIGRVQGALNHLDPDIGYNDWKGAIAAVHDFTGGNEEGFQWVDEWSRKGRKYKPEGRSGKGQSVRDLWDRLGDGCDDPVGLGTLFMLAKQSGWADPAPELNPNYNAEADPTYDPTADDGRPAFDTEAGLAEFIARRHPDELFYGPDTKAWHCWNGKLWEEKKETDPRILKLILDEIRRLRALDLDAKDTEVRACRDGQIPAGETQEKALARLAKERNRIQSKYDDKERSASLNSTRTLLSSFVRREGQGHLDADKFLMNVQNGVLDLRTGELLPHDPKYLMTKIAKVAYNREAKCPTWLKSLDDALCGRQDILDYMQEILGYAMTGDTSIQLSYWLVGEGNNGKSTLLNTIGEIWGSYAVKLSSTMFTHTRQQMAKGSPDPELLNTRGARFGFSKEARENVQLDEAVLKDLVSTDPLTARALYSNTIVTFRPEFKLFPPFNTLPGIASTSNSIFRRICPIPFDRNYGEGKRTNTGASWGWKPRSRMRAKGS